MHFCTASFDCFEANYGSGEYDLKCETMDESREDCDANKVQLRKAIQATTIFLTFRKFPREWIRFNISLWDCEAINGEFALTVEL